ncbi:MAG TPA: DUF1385 domain-containing protein [Thermomicrobiales bacterium]|nr:DUF1385 domain-containing protein [Thermomicrobiales bacterium]
MAKYYYGGQAVMEGVMMRGRRQMAVAVRRPDGRVALYSEPLDSWVYRSPIRNWPLLRGVFVLWDALLLGMRALTLSANVALGGMDGAEGAAGDADGGLAGPALWATVAVSLCFAVGLFFVLPLGLIHFLDRWIASALVSNVVEGVIRLALLLGYLALIGLMPDVRRLFGYHGAEHKTINAYEAGAPLDVAAVQRQSTLHTRCGTGFLLIVVLFSIVVFAFLGRPPLPLRVLSRIALVPVIAACAYEFVRFGAAHYGNRAVRALLTPSLALQRLTTREPDDGMVEAALVAFKRVLVADDLLAPDDAALGAAVAVDAAGAPLVVGVRR